MTSSTKALLLAAIASTLCPLLPTKSKNVRSESLLSSGSAQFDHIDAMLDSPTGCSPYNFTDPPDLLKIFHIEDLGSSSATRLSQELEV